MADHQAPPLNINATNPRWFDPKSHPFHILGLKPFSSLRALPLKLSSPSKPPWPELFKLITSNNAPLPKPSQNQIQTTTTTVETHPKSNHNHHDGRNLAKIKSQQRPTSPPNHKIKSHPSKLKHKTHKT